MRNGQLVIDDDGYVGIIRKYDPDDLHNVIVETLYSLEDDEVLPGIGFYCLIPGCCDEAGRYDPLWPYWEE